jgi:hypothetical protein
MQRVVILLALASTASCASSGSKPESSIAMPSERIVAVDNQGVLRTTVAPNAKAPVPGAPDRVFRALQAAYEELGIPIVTRDAAAGRIGNVDFWKSRTLGNVALSTYLHCGESFTGSAADNYRVYISLVSVVRSDGAGGSELETAFAATAQNMEGTSATRVACGTTGRLEDRIRKSVLLKLGAGTE